MKNAFVLPTPAALPLNALRDALHASHLPATVKPLGRDGIKVTPGPNIPRPSLEAFVRGFLAGFAA